MANTKITAANIDSTSTGFTLADLTVDTTTLVVDASNNRVGIGTSSPTNPLHVFASTTDLATFETTGAYNFISLENATRDWALSVGSGFSIYDKTASATRVTVDSSGRLGVGTASPTATLSLAKGIGYNADSSLYSDISVNDTAVNNNAVYRWRTGITGNASGHSLTFSTLGRTESSYIERLRIDDEGRVAIGISNPTHPLHVKKDVSNDTIDETKGLVKFQSSGGNGMIFGTIASSPYTSYIQSAYVIDTSLAQYNLALNPIGGNVGINDTTPSHALDVNGVIGIKGNAVIDSDTVSHYFKTASTGVLYFYPNNAHYMNMSSSGFFPATDNTIDLGSASKRWANIHSGDLHLSNEGSQNDVDGTSGNWTIQEGDKHLFIINNKSGKKYKFVLEEIE